MKPIRISFLIASVVVAATGSVFAERVHQTVEGEELNAGEGGSAIDKGVMEAKVVEGAKDKVARVKGNLNQWGFVNAWFGLPTPAGASTVRFRLYVEDPKIAKCLVYVRGKDGQIQVGELKLPADAAPNTFIEVNLRVDVKEEWSGLVVKKADASNLPGPWIDTISVVLPE